MDIFGKHDAIRNRMLSDGTHRMKNMLGGIGGFAALLRKDIPDDDPRSDLVDRIRESVIRLDEFLVDFMTLLRKQHPETEEVDLPTAFREACNQHFESDEETLAESPIAAEFHSKRIRIAADPILLRRCFYHAVRFLALVSTEYGLVRTEENETDIHIRFPFKSREKLQFLTEDPLARIETLESIDARISLLICMKMCRIHHGRAWLERPSGNSWILHLRLRKDCKT